LKVLAVTYGLPWPLTEGAKIRDFHLLRELAREAEVSLLAFCKDDRTPPDATALKRFCSTVEVYIPPKPTVASCVSAYLHEGIPLAALPFYNEPFAKRITACALSVQADTVQIEHSFLAPYAKAIPPNCHKVLSLHNIGERQYAGMARLPGATPAAWLKAYAMRGWESDWARRFDHCITVSAAEAAWLEARAPGLPLTVIDNGVDCESLKQLPPSETYDVLFPGVLGYPPNADAVMDFARNVLPLLRRTQPDARFLVVGRNPGAELKTLAAEGVIELHQDVPDMEPFFRRARAIVVPLRAGGGTRLKILEAMARGCPVISTSIGCEGLDVEHGNQLLVADSAEAMAASVASILASAQRAAEIADKARAWVEQRHDWKILGARLRDLHRSLTRPA
jgi:polysaccharide biosynthesis protein PslH